jgi:hypothetical protein
MANMTMSTLPARKSGDKATTTMIDAGNGEVLPSKLTREQSAELEKCEAVIKKGWGTFLEVGRALATIRNKELFKGKYDNLNVIGAKSWVSAGPTPIV